MNRLLSLLRRGLAGVLLSSACGAGDPAAAPSTGRAPKLGASPVAHVNAAGAAKLLAEKKAVVLDVRTPGEFAARHIAGATNIDFQAKEFTRRLEALDKSKVYLVHCASGGRSTRSLDVFRKLEFQHVVHLDGGFNAWKKADQPVTK